VHLFDSWSVFESICEYNQTHSVLPTTGKTLPHIVSGLHGLMGSRIKTECFFTAVVRPIRENFDPM